MAAALHEEGGEREREREREGDRDHSLSYIYAFRRKYEGPPYGGHLFGGWWGEDGVFVMKQSGAGERLRWRQRGLAPPTSRV
jgi:hypothetical protein